MNPPSQWNQDDFNKFQDSLTPARRKADAALMKKILEAAAEVPTAREALAWAQQHGIKFFIDRTAEGVAGYYTRTTGVLGLSAAQAEKNFDYLVGTLAHEIRHAWQDYHGYAKQSGGSFVEYMISDALIEADAFAYGERVRDEYKALKLAKAGKDIPPALQASLADKTADLREKFFSWYANPKKLQFYGDAALRHCANKAFQDPKKKVATVNRKYEFSCRVRIPPSKLDLSGPQGAVPLGADFSGSPNYLAAVPSDVWYKKLLRPALAYTFWGAANDNQRKLAAEVRKETARQQLAAIRARRMPPLP